MTGEGWQQSRSGWLAAECRLAGSRVGAARGAESRAVGSRGRSRPGKGRSASRAGLTDTRPMRRTEKGTRSLQYGKQQFGACDRLNGGKHSACTLTGFCHQAKAVGSVPRLMMWCTVI